MRALIIAAGDPPERAVLDAAWPGWSDDVELVIAADGGALAADRLGLHPHLVVGDFDSLAPDAIATLRERGVPVETAPAAKDESDTELAVRAALARGADALTIVGGTGGRPDHLLANVGLLALPELAGRAVELLDETTRISLLRGPSAHDFAGRPGDIVSLLPVGAGVEGVATDGLQWTLRDEPLPIGPARGLSNLRTAPVARVTVRAGLLLVVETAVAESSARLPP